MDDKAAKALQAMHDRIMLFATEWATNDDCIKSALYGDMAFGVVLTWPRVAEVLGVPSSCAQEIFNEYLALIGE